MDSPPLLFPSHVASTAICLPRYFRPCLLNQINHNLRDAIVSLNFRFNVESVTRIDCRAKIRVRDIALVHREPMITERDFEMSAYYTSSSVRWNFQARFLVYHPRVRDSSRVIIIINLNKQRARCEKLLVNARIMIAHSVIARQPISNIKYRERARGMISDYYLRKKNISAIERRDGEIARDKN